VIKLQSLLVLAVFIVIFLIVVFRDILNRSVSQDVENTTVSNDSRLVICKSVRQQCANLNTLRQGPRWSWCLPSELVLATDLFPNDTGRTCREDRLTD
jgi:hypothetical protein